jgi:hypothetical protein
MLLKTLLVSLTLFSSSLAIAGHRHERPEPRHRFGQVHFKKAHHQKRHRNRHLIGDVVRVSWGSRDYAARILAARGDRYLVTYIGWSSMWDEWVDDDRIRFRRRNAL